VVVRVGWVVWPLVFGLFGASACGAREPARTLQNASAATPAPADAAMACSVGEDGSPSDAEAACPGEMVLVSGDYCPKVRQACKRWMDPPPYQDYRCAEYAPSECLATRVPQRFCIDREEYVKPGDSLPLAHQSWTSAGAVCESRGARLCRESEWQFACEGEEMRPYPYGFSRDSTACNIDQMNLGKPQAGLNDLRAPVTAYPKCLSPFGVHDMSGNVEEWASLDHGRAPDRSTMKGAWWLPGKNTCRAATNGHGEIYEGPQVGVRCCKDAGP
jgi:sulfatase modifying factor 1